MKKFEYKTIIIKPTVIKATGFWKATYNPEEIDQQLNELGSLGWELVSVEGRNSGAGDTAYFLYTFKREI